jgi:hypothetical protein
MSEQLPSPDQDEPGGDYEYDLAHEWLSAPQSEAPPFAGDQHAPGERETTADDEGGDYGYELSHEVPGR